MARAVNVYMERLWEMTRSEFKLREQSTLFGFVWTLLHPLLLFLVLYGLFTKWMGNHTPDYASYLLIGIVQFGFFNNGSTAGLSSLVRRSSLLLNFRIPRETVVLSAVMSVTISYLFELGLMLAFMLAVGVKPHATWLFVPALVAIHFTLVAGLSLWLSVAAARYRDLERIWGILMMAGFFVTPIFYTLDSISPGRRRILLLNPMTHIIEMTRACILRGEPPPLGEFSLVACVCALLFGAGWAFFKRNELSLADYVIG